MFVLESLPMDAPLEPTSPYGWRYIDGKKEFHNGIDLKRNVNKTSTAILAVKAGTVVKNYHNKYRGNVVIIRHDDIYETLYQHLAAMSPLSVGKKVKAGEFIGIMGNSGYSFGVHLHFEVHEKGKPIDPTPYLNNIQKGITDMTKEEVTELIKQTLKGKKGENSKWFKDEFDTDEEKALLAKITDGTRPQGYATREEVAAMIARAMSE